MLFFPFSWILDLFQWTPFDLNPVDSFCQGLIGACGISVLYNLMRVYNFIQACSDSHSEHGSKRRPSLNRNPLRKNWRASLQFWSLTVLLSLVGLRAASLIVLEFLLRAVSAWTSTETGATRGVDFLLIQSQFSLGCSLTCTLAFLHQGAPHSSFSLILAAALSWALASYSSRLWTHVATLYPLHSTEHCCGKCMSLLTTGHTILASLQRLVILTFAVGSFAGVATVSEHFLSHKDAIKFWTPLTLCYTMLVVYIQEEQQRLTDSETLLRTVMLRLGGLLVLMLLLGNWSDVFHILISFLGEGACLLPSQDLLQAALKEEKETSLSQSEKTSNLNTRTTRTSSYDGQMSTSKANDFPKPRRVNAQNDKIFCVNKFKSVK
ncbi:transmembrane protein 82-like [Nematolebias whitei]|uniref:transmembrane protein 82-like n=1 Tax=Nematolebias whitei TaxID=451745 RepID=UPI001897DA15|nr:transmembrane protein 82-like [Nematolebias whitei]